MSNFISYITASYRVISDKVYEYFDDVTNDTENRLFKEESKYNKYISFFCEPTHIIDDIYLGSAYNAANFYQLSNLDINIIINMTKEISLYFPDYYKYERYALYDNDNEDIDNILDEVYCYIIKNEGKRILIHCKMGASRSVSVVIFYLIKKHAMTIESAIEYIKSKRNIINPNCKFIETLKSKIDKK